MGTARFDKKPDLPYDGAALGNQISGTISAGPCELLEFAAKNNAAAVRYLFFQNRVAPAAGQPANNYLPVPVPAGGTASDEVQIRFTTGLSWMSSTTDLLATATAAADMIVTARVRQLVSP